MLTVHVDQLATPLALTAEAQKTGVPHPHVGRFARLHGFARVGGTGSKAVLADVNLPVDVVHRYSLVVMIT